MPKEEPTLSELVDQLGELKREANAHYSAYKDMQVHIAELSGLLQAKLELVGLRSAKSAKYGASISQRTNVVVTSEVAVKEWLLNEPNIEHDFYIGLKLTPFKQLANQVLKETGEVIPGTEREIKETITIKANKKG